MSEPDATTKPRFEQFAVVEILGHQTYAGMVTEETLFGATMLRVDVPETERGTAYTKYFGAASIYGVTPCDEATALAVVKHTNSPAISVYIPEPPRMLPAGSEDDDHGHFEYPEDDDRPEDPFSAD